MGQPRASSALGKSCESVASMFFLILSSKLKQLTVAYPPLSVPKRALKQEYLAKVLRIK